MGLEDFVIERFSGSRLGYIVLCRAAGSRLSGRAGWLSVPSLIFVTASFPPRTHSQRIVNTSNPRPAGAAKNTAAGFCEWVQGAKAVWRSQTARLKATVDIQHWSIAVKNAMPRETFFKTNHAVQSQPADVGWADLPALTLGKTDHKQIRLSWAVNPSGPSE